MSNTTIRLITILLFSVAATSSLSAQTTPGPAWKNGVAQLGTVRVDAVNRSVIATGWVNQVEGLIELLACGPGGKCHESLFVLPINPLDLQTGLLLLGLKPGLPPGDADLGKRAPRENGATTAQARGPTGPEVDIWVDWQVNGKTRSVRAEKMVKNTETKRPLPGTGWTFTGSVVEKGEFMAKAEESFVATFWDPWAILNLTLPCGADGDILVINTANAPPLGASITMRFVKRRTFGERFRLLFGK